jgi:hypothetical protein
MTEINLLLDRRAAADFLAERGFPCSPATLATAVTRGGGPAFQKFGPRVLYRQSDLVAWAEGKLSAPRRSTSEADRAA